MRRQGINDNGEVQSSVYVHKEKPHPGLGDFGASLTRQEFAEECDINTIMAKYETTGVINHWNKNAPVYLDLSEGVPDLQRAMDVLEQANAAFMTLPAKIRLEFENDPKLFVAFAEDKENLEQLREWGLAPPAPKPPVVKEVEVPAGPAVVPKPEA